GVAATALADGRVLVAHPDGSQWPARLSLTALRRGEPPQPLGQVSTDHVNGGPALAARGNDWMLAWSERGAPTGPSEIWLRSSARARSVRLADAAVESTRPAVIASPAGHFIVL